ncbi:hypothetical protein ABZ388_22300 [Micromonospora parva]|uniref:hypothetical protein n=1 Tax=Micromonospora parva TaxID=1464048 RepID=UPI0033F86CAA
MTDPFDTGAAIFVLSPLTGGTAYCLHPVPNWRPTLTDEFVTFTDPLTSATVTIYVTLREDGHKTTTRCLAPSDGPCPLCHDAGTIGVRVDLTYEAQHGGFDDSPGPGAYADAIKPCPACRPTAFHLSNNDTNERSQ